MTRRKNSRKSKKPKSLSPAERGALFYSNVKAWESEEQAKPSADETESASSMPSSVQQQSPTKRRRLSHAPFTAVSQDIFVNSLLPYCPKASFRLICRAANDKILAEKAFLEAYIAHPARADWWDDFIQVPQHTKQLTSAWAISDKRGPLPFPWRKVLCMSDEDRLAFNKECLWLFCHLQRCKEMDAKLGDHLTFLKQSSYPLHPLIVDLDQLLSRTFNPRKKFIYTSFGTKSCKKLPEETENPCAMAFNNGMRFLESFLFEKDNEEYKEFWEMQLGLRDDEPKMINAQKVYRELKEATEARYDDVCALNFDFPESEGMNLWVQCGTKMIGDKKFLFGFGVQSYPYH
uniref:Uncharacterized protein n=1 Tax=Percolomonas cosmopolitus TaxID=63605 RepID=A0A7S1KS45_9EUKA|mmetsp:Transcript_7119/g.26658  ORF Transcript_7119/g.26658 Transcript_7119/m.26658 type:complete len:347 (+) Transcript_7119:1-1041(+)